MKLLNLVRNAVWGVFVTTLMLFAGSSAAQNQDSPARGQIIDGLQITIHLDQPQAATSNVPRFRVELRNAGKNDLLLNLGTVASEDGTQYPIAISLILGSPGRKSQRLEPVKMRQATEAKPQPLVLPLPAGATFSMPVDLANYHTTGSNERISQLQPGTYTVEVQFTDPNAASADESLRPPFSAPRPRQVHMWERTFDTVNSQPAPPTSNRLQFEVSSRP